MTEMSRTKTIILAICVGAGYIAWGLLISLQPPFYPSEAEKKGAKPSQYGFVFGIANMAAFIFSPIFGRFGTKIGLKLLYNSGAFIQATCGILFGFLEYVDNTNAFIGISYFLRFMTGVADAAALGAILSILMKLYPNAGSTVVSLTEMSFGLGAMLGPALGSALYELGGFSLPFFSVGGFTFIIAVALWIVVPSVKIDDVSQESRTTRSLTYSALFKSPAIFFPFIDNFICFCGNGLIESMLEPHMKENAGATQLQVGVSFLILGGVYMVSTPLVGMVCDRVPFPIIVSMIGNVLLSICTFLIGPAPFLTMPPTVGLIQGCMALCGLAYGMIVVSTFNRSQKAALRKGFNDDIDTYLIISGMWSSSLYMGNFVGPTISGFVVENLGFRNASMGFFGLFLILIALEMFEFFHEIKTKNRQTREGYIEIGSKVEPEDNGVLEVPQ